MNIEEFGIHIFTLRQKSGISRGDFQKKWGFHLNSIKSYEKEGRSPPMDYLAALSAEVGCDFLELVKLLLSCSPVLATHNISTDELLKGVYQQDTSLTYIVNNDCMAPTISNGAKVTVDRERDAEEGDIVLIEVQNSLTARRIQYDLGNQVRLSCDNTNYSHTLVSFEEYKKLKIIGVIKTTLNTL
jgi:hypothetical protein